jgi:ATP-dependent DNA helicase RecQ
MIDTSPGDEVHRRRLAVHLDAMLALCETATCRRKQMLAYFGEPATHEGCGNCDTCLTPPQVWDGTIAAQKFLSAVYRLDKERGQKFGAGHVIDILTGKRNPKVAEYRHDELSVFGVGADLRDTEWRGVARQLLAQGLLGVEGDYGVLILTPDSAAVLRRQRDNIMFRREPERARAARKPRPVSVAEDLGPEETKIFERLREWRAGQAREQGVPAYVIFQDRTLREIASQQPADLGGLSGVSGVGQAKLSKYGEQILEVLAG